MGEVVAVDLGFLVILRVVNVDVVVVLEALEVLEMGFGVAVEFFPRDVDLESLPDVVSMVQSTRLHLSLQSGKHISVQLVVPPGQPQAHLSTFEFRNDQAPSRVPTKSA